MVKVLRYVIVSAAGAFIWIILNEKAGPAETAAGFASGLAAVLFTDRFLLQAGKGHTPRIPIINLIFYPFYLLFRIYASGFNVFIRILSGRMNPKLTSIDIDQENSFYSALIANSITLTPGSITVDKEGARLCVLYLEDPDKCMLSPRDNILGRYESLLREGRHDE